MPIKVSSIDLITKENIQDMIYYYNNFRPHDFEPIEMVEYKDPTRILVEIRMETSHYGQRREAPQQLTSKVASPPEKFGLRIASSKPNYSYSNGTYKYMRWQMKTLSSMYNYPSFSIEEEILLFRIMMFVLGKENVSYYRTYDQAIKHSPSFNHITFSDLLTNSPRRSPIPTNIRTGQSIFKPVVDTTDLSLSSNLGWKFPRVRI